MRKGSTNTITTNHISQTAKEERMKQTNEEEVIKSKFTAVGRNRGKWSQPLEGKFIHEEQYKNANGKRKRIGRRLLQTSSDSSIHWKIQETPHPSNHILRPHVKQNLADLARFVPHWGQIRVTSRGVWESGLLFAAATSIELSAASAACKAAAAAADDDGSDPVDTSSRPFSPAALSTPTTSTQFTHIIWSYAFNILITTGIGNLINYYSDGLTWKNPYIHKQTLGIVVLGLKN